MSGEWQGSLEKPIVRVFKYVDGHDTDYGVDGWVMRGAPAHFDPNAGLGVAHDALEHFGPACGLDAEMKAFGSILYGRVAHNFGGSGEPDVFGEELAEFYVDNGDRCRHILPQEPIEGWAELWMEALGKYAIEAIDDDAAAAAFSHHFQSRIVHWIRRGFRMNEARWEARGGSSMFMDMFENIHTQVDAIGSPDIGDLLRVRMFGGVRGCFIERYDRYGREWA